MELGTYNITHNGQTIANNGGLSPDNHISTGTYDLESQESFSIITPSAYDAGINAILSPNNGCNLSNNEAITLILLNNGLNDIDSLDLFFNIINSNSDTEHINFSPALAPNATDTFTFNTGADLSTFGNFNIKVGVILANDGYANNDSLQITVTNVMAQSLSLYSDFDNAIIGSNSTVDSTWAISSSTPFLWEVIDKQTPSLNTGPNGDFDETGNFLFTEASYGSMGDQTELSTGCISFSGVNNPTLDFYYHKYGATIGNLYIEIFDNLTWEKVDTIIGQTHLSVTDPWAYKTIDLSAYSNKNVQIRFVGERGSSFDGDMAIDEVSIYNKLAKDAFMMNIHSPNTQCALSNAESITLTFKNMGSDSMITADISYWIDSGVVTTESLYFNPPLGFNDLYTHTFSTTADLSIVGHTYVISTSINYTGDANATNDTINKSVTHITPISSPYSNNFDHIADGVNGVFDAEWHATPDAAGFMWQSETTKTGSLNTGPSGDHTSGTGTYLYTEASSGLIGDTAYLNSSCISLSGTNSPIMSFYYHFYGATMGNLYIDIYYNNNWQTIDSIIGQQHLSDADPWKEKLVSLIPYIGAAVAIRLRAIRGSSFTSDMCIDDILIFNAPNKDIQLSEIQGPSSGCGLGSSSVITATVKNVGFDTLTSFSASYTLFGNTINETIQVIPPIGFGETFNFDFSSPVDLSTPGMSYSFDFIITLNGDTNHVNDSILGHKVDHFASIPSPYSESFDNIADGLIGKFDFVWMGEPSISSSFHWESNIGTTLSTNTGPIGDHLTGSGTFLYTEASSGATGGEAFLTSSCINLNNMVAPAFGFWYHKYGADMGDLYFEVQDEGQWITLDSIMGQTHTTTTSPWLQKVVDLQAFKGKSISIRFKGTKGTSFYGDMAIDDVSLYDMPNIESEILTVVSPASKCELDFSISEAVSIKIKNNGSQDIDSVNIGYVFDGGNPVNELHILNPPLSSTKDTIISFTAGVNVVGSGTHSVMAFINVSGDNNPLNDSTIMYFESLEGGTLNQTAISSVSIPDGDKSGIMIPISFCGLPNSMDSCFYVKRLTIDSLTHTWISDLSIHLISPADDTLDLSIQNGGSADNLIGVSFTFDAINNISSQISGILPGDYQPEETIGFNKFFNTDPNGLWYLWLVDGTSSDQGILHKFTFEFHNDKPEINFGSDTTLCSWAVITLDAGSGNQSYLWQNGSSGSTFVIDANTLSTNTTHNFNVTVVGNNGCSNYNEINIFVENCTGINSTMDKIFHFNLFPNPIKETFSIFCANDISLNSNFKILNIQGKVIDEKHFDFIKKGDKIHWSVNGWAEGIYYLNIKIGGHSSMQRLSIVR